MACHAALRTASAPSSGSQSTVHQAPAAQGMPARVDTRTLAHGRTALWKWVGVAIVAAVVAVATAAAGLP